MDREDGLEQQKLQAVFVQPFLSVLHLGACTACGIRLAGVFVCLRFEKRGHCTVIGWGFGDLGAVVFDQ